MTLHAIIRGRKVAYSYSRLNSTTYLIVHKDKFKQYPFIYVKVYPQLRHAVVIDTGCGPLSNEDDDAEVTELKSFIEEFILYEGTAASGNDSTEHHRYDYTVICTHCHFDHICGIEAFASAGANIVASSHDKDFISPANLPKNSLCDAFGLQTPHYRVTTFAVDGERLAHRSGASLGLRIVHTPGHTPDELAVYDETERWLFVGDTCYRRIHQTPWGVWQAVAIEFTVHGNWTDYAASLQRLVTFVASEECMNDSLEAARRGDVGAVMRGRVRIACGHTTSDAPAAQLLNEVFDYFCRVVVGLVPVKTRMSRAGEIFALWQDEGEPELSILAPERLLDEIRTARAPWMVENSEQKLI